MTNVVRRTLARMANRVLDELFSAGGLHQAQQAFFSKGRISHNLTMMQCIFQDHKYLLDELLLILSLDCSKAYNRVGWSWVKRCLAASRLPASLQRLILAFLPGTVHLVFRGIETDGVSFLSGLAQGCPLSCFIFLLIVDPLLHKLSSTSGVVGLSAFADDWTVLCRDFQTLFMLRPILRVFELASGQIINESKSSIVPSRRLTDAEVKCCLVHWRNLQVLYSTRILGLLIGLDVSIEDQFRAPLDKFAKALQDFSKFRDQMALATRIAVISTFFFSLFSFVSGFFYMPTHLLRSVESQVLSFISRVPFTRLGIFAHVKRLYGITTELRDLRLLNVSGLLATYVQNPRNESQLRESLRRIRARLPPGGYAHQPGRPPTRLEHPAYSWLCAHAFFMRTGDQSPDELYERALPARDRRDALDFKLPSIQTVLYNALLAFDAPAARAFLGMRIRAKVRDDTLFFQGLARVAAQRRKFSQAQLWHLFRIHLNGHMTTHRLFCAQQAPAELPCFLCQAATDSVSHILACPTIHEAFQIYEEALPDQATAPKSLEHIFFQLPIDTEDLHRTLASFTAAWACRGAVQHGCAANHLAECIARGMDHPWILAGGSSCKKARRAARIRPPLTISQTTVRFRADGGRGMSSFRAVLSAWGAALWAAGIDPAARPSAVASGVCPEPATHNIAEFFSLRECLRKALRDPPTSAIFELDSLLVVMMMSGLWGCHRKHLLTLLKECYDLGEQLAAAGCAWSIRHIYREYNTVADALAGQCIRTGRGTSRNWH